VEQRRNGKQTSLGGGGGGRLDRLEVGGVSPEKKNQLALSGTTVFPASAVVVIIGNYLFPMLTCLSPQAQCIPQHSWNVSSILVIK